jgi:D-alanyl-D-alanine carboxypeptidase/D-alanyl-D-alanine-endopeptidase (penicillin-binding protein 4)
MPGSALKVATLAEAAATLGWNFTYETRLVASGEVSGGVLDGDLVVIGSGDPSLVERDGSAARVFADWAAALKSTGIRAITGRIVGDDHAFDDEELGPGWAWDDLVDGFATGVSALQYNENAARLTIAPGASVGAPAIAHIAPSGSGLVIQNVLTTAAAGVPAHIEARRLRGSARLDLRGSIPIDGRPVGRTLSVDNPTLFFVTALRDSLIGAGIEVRGDAVDIDTLAAPLPRTAGSSIVTYRSPPLSTLAATMMKASQNLYAETLLKTVGAVSGAPTLEGGRVAGLSVLESWGIAPASVIQVDGSGLSRYNYITPEALVTIMSHVDHDEGLRSAFENSLPIGGRDGTLVARFLGTPAEGNVRAKTGTLANARALTGYVTTTDGEPLVFAVLCNNYGRAPAVAISAIDAVVARLAALRR